MAWARILKAFLWWRGKWDCSGWRWSRSRGAIVRHGFEILMRARRAAVARDERLNRTLCFAGFWLRLIRAALHEGAAGDSGGNS
jgi:hypothetical protein